MEENLKRALKILHGQWTESLIVNLGGYSKYEAINCEQDFIGMLKLIEGVMFKFEGNKEPTQAMWEAYVSVFWCRQQKIETNQEYFERFKNAMSIITQHEGSIGQETGLVNHLGSKEDTQEISWQSDWYINQTN